MLDQFQFRELCANDYEQMISLWRNTPGVGLSDADSSENMNRFLARNKGLCFAAVADGKLIGTALCGQDGRRGYIYHLAVHPFFRRQGIGKRLVAACLDGLNKAGIDKCHLFVFADNRQGMAFWETVGFLRRNDIQTYSRAIV